MSAPLDARARELGLILERPGEHAEPVPERTKRALVDILGGADSLPPASASDPARAAHVPPFLEGTRAFGVVLQLYQLRSPRNLGVGDLGDLRALLRTFADLGADFVGLNPLHALFTAAPERASPFSPSDRRRLNPLIIAADDVPGYAPAMREGVAVPPTTEQVDYPAAAAAKLAVLRRVFQAWRTNEVAVPDAVRTRVARHADQPEVRAFALFEALSHAMAAEGRGAGWTGWPAEFASSGSATVRAFAESHANEIAFHAWLQGVATMQLADVQAAALASGMRLGLYLDLAVGEAPDGASTWADPSLVLTGVTIGAPPDLFSVDGQDWGLAPLSPGALAARDYAPYRAVMAAVMESAGAMRIDHAMGLERLWLVPAGASPREGAYVRQGALPREVVEATHRHRALAIGEDLGIVPPGFRERMDALRLFSMRLLPFERTAAGALAPPARYPADALACLSTHDIAPLEAWWRGDEIDLRLRLKRIPPAVARDEQRGRRHDKQALLQGAGLPPGRADGPLTDALVVTLHRLGARTASRLYAVRLEDVLGGRRLVNLPGTDREHPNWRNTLPVTVEEIARSALLEATLLAVASVRGKP